MLKEAVNRNIIGASKMTIQMLEDALIKDLPGTSLDNKLKEFNAKYDKSITEQGHKIFILEKMTNTINLDHNTQSNNDAIPKTIRSMVWNEYIGEEKGIGKCYVCESKIDSKHYECGHIVARAENGDSTIENLRCICSLCNKSIGTKNMDDFKKKYLSKNNQLII